MTQDLLASRFGPERVECSIDAPPFIKVAAKRGHRRRYGKAARVMLSGATVDVSTANLAAKWRGASLSLGLLHDQVYAFAKKRGFKPARRK